MYCQMQGQPIKYAQIVCGVYGSSRHAVNTTGARLFSEKAEPSHTEATATSSNKLSVQGRCKSVCIAVPAYTQAALDHCDKRTSLRGTCVFLERATCGRIRTLRFLTLKTPTKQRTTSGNGSFTGHQFGQAGGKATFIRLF